MDSSPDDFIKSTRQRQPPRVIRTRAKKKTTKAAASVKIQTKSTESTSGKAKEALPVNQTCPCCRVKVESDFSVHVNFCLARFSKSNQDGRSKSKSEESSKSKEANERCVKCSKAFPSKRECYEHTKTCGSSDNTEEQEIDDFKRTKISTATLRPFQTGATMKMTKKRKDEDKQDAQLQLALALSASLSQKGNINAPQPRKGKDKNAKKGETLLKFRSKDSRKAAITERLGMVLMENSMEEETRSSRGSPTYSSPHLTELKQSDTLKWKLAGESLDGAAYQEFYVGALRDFVIPQSKPYQPQFRSWTQIPGRELTLLSQQIQETSDDEDSVCTQDVLEDLYDISGVHSMLQQTLRSVMEGPEFLEERVDLDDTINKENEPPDSEEIRENVKTETCRYDISSDEEIIPCSTQKSNTDSESLSKCTISLGNASKKLIFMEDKSQSAIDSTKEACERMPLKTKTSSPIVSVSLEKDKDEEDEIPGLVSTEDSMCDTIPRPSHHQQVDSADTNDDTILVPPQEAVLKPTTLFSFESASDTDSDDNMLGKSPKLKLSTRNRQSTPVRSEENAIMASPSDNLSEHIEDGGLSKSPPQNCDLEASKNNVLVSETSLQRSRLEISESDYLLQNDHEIIPLKSPEKNISPKSPLGNNLAESLRETLVKENFLRKSPQNNSISTSPQEPDFPVSSQKDSIPTSPQEPALHIASPLKDAESSRSSIFSDDTVVRSPSNLVLPEDSQSSLDDIFEKSHSDDQKDSDVDEANDKSSSRKSPNSVDNIPDEASPSPTKLINGPSVGNKIPSGNKGFFIKTSILSNWYDLWKTRQHSDLLINCKDQKLSAHSLVIKTQGGKLWEKCWDEDAQELDFTRWHSSVVDSLLCALYSGQVKNVNLEEVLKIAEEYNITALANADGVDAEDGVNLFNSFGSNVLQNKIREISRNCDESEKSQGSIGIRSEIDSKGKKTENKIGETSSILDDAAERCTIGETSRMDSERENTKVDKNTVTNIQETSILSTDRLMTSAENASVTSLSFSDMDADSDDFFLCSPTALAASSKEDLNTRVSGSFTRSQEKKTVLEVSDIDQLIEIEAPTKKRKSSLITSCSPTRTKGDGSFYNPFDVEDTSNEPKTKSSRLSLCDQVISHLGTISRVVRGRSPEVLNISSDDSNNYRHLEDGKPVTKMETLPETEVEANKNDGHSSEDDIFVLPPCDRSISPNRVEDRLGSPSTSSHTTDAVTESPNCSYKSEEALDRFYKSLLERCKEVEEENKKSPPPSPNRDLIKSTENSEPLPEQHKESCSEVDAHDVWENPDWDFDYEDHFIHYVPSESDQDDVEGDNDPQGAKDDPISPKIPSCRVSPARTSGASSPLESGSLHTFGDMQEKDKENSRWSKLIKSDFGVSDNTTDESLGSDETTNQKCLEIKDKMAIDELNLEDSVLWRAENEPRQTPVTKTQASKKGKGASRTITPIPDYKSMATPALRKELRKYGLKQLSRNQATKMLSHIYEQLHPMEPKTPEQDDPESEQPGPSNREPKTKGKCERENVKKNTNEVKERKSVSSEDESSDGEVCLEETFRENENEIEDELTQTSSSEVNEAVLSYIRNNRRLHENILQFEPIWLDTLHTELKEAGIKCKMAHLMALFDNECIIYRLSQHPRNQNRRRKKRASPKQNRKKTKS